MPLARVPAGGIGLTGAILDGAIVQVVLAGCTLIAMQVVAVRLERTLKALAWDPDEIVF